MGRKLYAKGEGFNPSTSIEDVEGLREELDALKGGSGGGGGDNTAIERRLTTAEGEIDNLQRDVAEQSEEVAAVGAKVDTLQGTDSGKSVRTIAAEETAKIVGNAPANYDTLKEIADYIATDATGAAELNNKVYKNATDIANLDSNKLGKTEKAADSAKADSAAALTVKDTTVTSVSAGSLTYHFVMAANAGSLPYGDNANAVITIPSYGGTNYLHQLGFTGLGLFHRKFYNKVVDTTTPWSQIAFTDSTVANALQLGGVGADGYTRVLKGLTTTANNHLYIGTLPASSSATRDSISIRGTIGGFGGDRDFADIAIGRRNGLWFKGLSTFRYTGTSSYWDIAVNNAGEVYVLLYAPYCAYHIEVSSQDVTIWGVHGTSPSDTNWRYLREELEPFDKIKSDAFIGALQGNADSATKLATARKIWGQTFDGTGNIDGDMEVNGDVVIKGNVVIEGNITSGASYQSDPLSTASEDEVPSVEQQLRAQIATLEERIAALEQLIAQNNG